MGKLETIDDYLDRKNIGMSELGRRSGGLSRQTIYYRKKSGWVVIEQDDGSVKFYKPEKEVEYG